MTTPAGFPGHALAYAARGWPVFPLKPRDKVPLIPKAAGGTGVHDATTDPDRIREWWAREPHANIGLACGVAFWVLDVDFGGFESFEHDGLDTLDDIRRRFGPLPRTVRAQTGSGGWHHLFAPEPRIKNAVRVLPGLDVRSAGGYVVGAPSVHPNGAPYEWIEGPEKVPIATAPPWLVALVEPLDEPEPAAPARPIRTGDLSRYAAAALDKACERIAQAAIGTQCDTLEHEAYGIGRLVGGGVVPGDEAKAALVGAGLRMRSAAGKDKNGKPYKPWTRREIAWRVERALSAGVRNPRVPENR
jgi:hypothetical protein